LSAQLEQVQPGGKNTRDFINFCAEINNYAAVIASPGFSNPNCFSTLPR